MTEKTPYCHFPRSQNHPGPHTHPKNQTHQPLLQIQIDSEEEDKLTSSSHRKVCQMDPQVSLFFEFPECSGISIFQCPEHRDLKTRVTRALRDLKTRVTGALRDLKTRVTGALPDLKIKVTGTLRYLTFYSSPRTPGCNNCLERSSHSSFEFPERSGLSKNEVQSAPSTEKIEIPERSGNSKNRETGALWYLSGGSIWQTFLRLGNFSCSSNTS